MVNSNYNVYPSPSGMHTNDLILAEIMGCNIEFTKIGIYIQYITLDNISSRARRHQGLIVFIFPEKLNQGVPAPFFFSLTYWKGKITITP